jgi:hypothetical protein
MGFGFGVAHTPIDEDPASGTAMPQPPPCLLNNNCGIGNDDGDQDRRDLQAACDELQSRGESSPDCDALNQ